MYSTIMKFMQLEKFSFRAIFVFTSCNGAFSNFWSIVVHSCQRLLD